MKDFKVITNPNPRPEEEEEKELELTLIEPDVMADLYFTSAFFHYLKTGHDGYYFAEKELNEMELAQKKVFPLLERNFAEFVRLTGPQRLRMRVWERGSGITMACGTGACAAASAAVAAGHCVPDIPITVELDGGCLEILVQQDFSVTMTGPAAFVFEGETADEVE